MTEHENAESEEITVASLKFGYRDNFFKAYLHPMERAEKEETPILVAAIQGRVVVENDDLRSAFINLAQQAVVHAMEAQGFDGVEMSAPPTDTATADK